MTAVHITLGVALVVVNLAAGLYGGVGLVAVAPTRQASGRCCAPGSCSW